MIKALIIDDEVTGLETLRIALEMYCPEVAIAGTFSTPHSGLQAIKLLEPDLVFLDIQMPQMSGFDVLQQAAPINFDVIFVSAHDQYAIKAIKFSALDYLLKPVDVDELIHAVNKVKGRMDNKSTPFQYQSVLNNIQLNHGRIERLAVPSLEGIDFYNTDEIIYCQADGSYTNIILKNGLQVLVTKNLKDFESMLSESGFCRVHHSYLINLRHVKKYIKGDGGYVILSENHHVDISRRKKEEFLSLLNKL